MKASNFAPLVPDSCSIVLDAMYFTTVLESSMREALPEDLALGTEDFAFSLHFAGDFSGTFGLHLGLTMARTLASNFLGEEEPDNSRQEIAEVIGELSNMLCGSIMSRIEGVAKFDLTHPMPLVSLPSLECEDALVCTLDTDSGIVTAWVVVEGKA